MECIWAEYYKNSLKTFLLSNYPINKFPIPLVCKKITDIRKDLSQFDASNDTSAVNKSICSSIRKAIYDFSNIEDTDLEEILIPIDADDGKKSLMQLK